MTAEEAVQVIQEKEGHLCVRLYRRADGTMITADCPVGLRWTIWKWLRKRRAWAAALFAVLFLPACGMGMPRRPDPLTHPQGPQTPIPPQVLQGSPTIRLPVQQNKDEQGIPER